MWHRLKSLDYVDGLMMSMVVVSLDYACIAVLAAMAKLLGGI